ncbi:MAG: 30S ribosomal protein S1 [Treponema sp. GWB1_62_6]|nr:MAG: 30S ribosomal protein S1 [Treponema sp. GWB1_62_6]OHE66008.1 MAG: 30S ribosomal protein S1 [Treponema sp. GWA1_62_8]OHE69013.1 MAG: 30S ribosomal protein S1 [Treponema sp. GWC1_61_84]OHE69970.1 MAG: 30S ribosomal protein S1 [Treponema sp. RIFOXYC1_FULL_61_9]HCM28515.1 30S ribosomal protein S1 [Treponema sp.]
MNKLKPGQLVETQIVSISKDCIFLQLSGKSEGVLDRAELADQDGNISVKEGDTIKAYFLESKNGEMTFTTKISGDKAGSSLLENAYQNKIPVEGVVEKEIKGGFEIKIGTSRAFCPFSQMGARRTEDTAAYIGKKLTFKIQEYKGNGRDILVSNRAILEDERAAQLESLKKTLKEKMVVKGRITSIQDFGAFVDIGGVQALLPVSEIGRDRVEDIRSVLSVDQEIEASIIKIDWKAERISLSMKSLLSDPWVKATEKYPKNSKHTGKVVRITEFGAFVSLEPGLDGLVHVSELRGEGKYGDTRNEVKLGQSLTVLIQDIDALRKRISLKPTSSLEEDETTRKYLSGDDGGTDTYNPFAALLGKKK